MTAVSSYFVPLVVAVLTIIIAAQLLLYVAASVELRRIRRRDRHRLWRRILSSPLSPSVSVLVPAYNESVAIVESVRGLLALTYPNLEIVVVNDGSSDDTMDVLIEAFELTPVPPVFRRSLDTQPIEQILRSSAETRLIIVDKENGGKADALNAAMNVASGDLVCAIDADTLVNADALQLLVPPFLEDPEVVAVGGTIRLVNDANPTPGMVSKVHAPRRWLVGAQAVEYTRAFLIGRLAWNPLGGNLIISGAFGLFRRDAVIDVGGYAHGSVGEDMELIVRLRRRAYEDRGRARIVFSPDPVAWTEAPESARTLARQRNRWYRGLLDVLVRHRTMIGRPQYGTAGLLALPYFVLVEALAPVLELIGITLTLVGLGTGLIGPESLGPIAAAYLIGISATMLVLLFDDLVFGSYSGTPDRLRLVAYALFEQLLFRPATVVWRVWGLWLFLRGRKEWGAQERRGFARPASPSDAASAAA